MNFYQKYNFMKNITFVIFTYNEEKRIGAVVRNFIKYGEVLVLDDGSTDNTKIIAENLGARVVLRPKSDLVQIENQQMYEFVLSQTKTAWIFWSFADNFAPKELLEKLTEISEQDKIKYVNVPLYTYLWGATEYVAHKSHSPRFFMRDTMDFTNNYLHGMGKFLGSTKEILTLPLREKYAVRHYSLYNTEKFVSSHLRYALIEAQEKFAAGKKFSSLRLAAAMGGYFWLYYKSGWRNKKSGFIVALLYSFFRVMAYARLYELEKGLTLETMSANYSLAAEKLLKDI